MSGASMDRTATYDDPSGKQASRSVARGEFIDLDFDDDIPLNGIAVRRDIRVETG